MNPEQRARELVEEYWRQSWERCQERINDMLEVSKIESNEEYEPNEEEMRLLTIKVSEALSQARADGRREGLEEAAQIAAFWHEWSQENVAEGHEIYGYRQNLQDAIRKKLEEGK